jgi:hypothetical protein
MTAPEETSMPTPDDAPTGGLRVVVLAFNHRLADRVTAYTEALLGVGVGVDLVVPEERSLAQATLDPRVRVHTVIGRESDLPLRKAERVVLYKVPGGVLSTTGKVTGRISWPIPGKVVGKLQRGHRRVAGGVHDRMFMPFYRSTRAYLLARQAGRSLRGLDVAGADRIIAADIHAVALGWRLARRHPHVPATTSLDASVYTHPPVGI